MATRTSELVGGAGHGRTAARTIPIPSLSWDALSLISVVVAAGALYAWRLSENGYGNIYYAAAVRSMTVSWSNFFFGAFDPGGYITVDKPPAFLWVGALSARIFGYSSWSILLPSAVAGAASVGLLWAIVRKHFGLLAATVAAVALALSPIAAAVNRLNLPEPFMILALVGAAAAVLQSVESRRWWAWVVLAGFLVGVAFNIKMMAAWIPGPALALALVVSAREVSWRAARDVIARLAVLGAVTLAVSASWMVVVDVWPADARPYVGGSTDNTVLDLALGYNGFGRVDGESQGPGGRAPNAGPNQQPPPDGVDGGDGAQQAPGGLPVPPAGALPGGAGDGGGAAAGGFRGAGGIVAGVPGLWRMFDDANGGQIGWLLPFAIGSGVFALWWWRRDPARRAFATLFLGWVVLYGAVFSYAQGIFHSYYTSAMAPGVAALTGMGALAMTEAVRRDRRWLVGLAGLAAITLWAQLTIADRTPDFYGWVRPITVVTVVAGLGLCGLLALRRLPIAAGVATVAGGLLLLPAAWTVSAAANTSLNTTLPQAGPQQGASGRTFGSDAFDNGTAQIAAWLEANSDEDAPWQLVVSNSQNGSRLIAEYGISVMSIGGFSGSDNTTTVDEFADLVSSGSVRYILVGQIGVVGADGGGIPGDGPAADGGFRDGGMAGPGGGQGSAAAQVMAAVQETCTTVTDPDLPPAYQGSLYDCAGVADALRRGSP